MMVRSCEVKLKYFSFNNKNWVWALEFFEPVLGMISIILIITIIMWTVCRDVTIERPRTVSREVCDQRPDDSIQVPQVSLIISIIAIVM